MEPPNGAGVDARHRVGHLPFPQIFGGKMIGTARSVVACVYVGARKCGAVRRDFLFAVAYIFCTGKNLREKESLFLEQDF